MTGGAAADLGYLRDYNEALVLGAVRGAPTFERAGVAAVTGLTPQAVSKVLARLIDQGFVAPIGVTRRGVGKPPIAYRVVASSRYAIPPSTPVAGMCGCGRVGPCAIACA